MVIYWSGVGLGFCCAKNFRIGVPTNAARRPKYPIGAKIFRLFVPAAAEVGEHGQHMNSCPYINEQTWTNVNVMFMLGWVILYL